ncbi:MAG: ribonuclease HI [Balneolaceae bacterium]
MSEPQVEIYTDGACRGNPGPGGWGAVLLFNGDRKEISGGESTSTNNRMEMTAVCKALNALKRPCRVRLYSDSALIINAFNQGWIKNWKRRGWRKSNKQPVENRDLWEEILEAATPHQVEWIKIKGHAGIEENERADQLAVEASKQFL